MNGNGPLLVGWKQISQFLQCSEKHARMLRKKHDLPVNKRVNRIYAVREDIVRWARESPSRK